MDSRGATRLSVIGLGKLGAPMAAVFAAKGFDVIGVDLNPAFVDAINAGQAPVDEPQLQAYIDTTRGRLRATASFDEAVAASDISFIIVPTPSGPNHFFANEYVIDAVVRIGAALRHKRGDHLIVVTSTVMPGSTGSVIRNALETSSGRSVGVDVGLCYSPEFIALGSVVRDLLNPDMVLIGECDPVYGERLADVYRRSTDSQPSVRRMNFVNAEICKIAVNTFVTTKISYANMLADLCDHLEGADVDVITAALGADTRIGPKYLKGGVAYGGPCFPRDNKAFAALARTLGVPCDIAEATDRINDHQVQRLFGALAAVTPRGGCVAVLGVSYKLQTAVIEQSQGMALARLLVSEGFRVILADPLSAQVAKAALDGGVEATSDFGRAIAAADAAVITTPWPDIVDVDPKAVEKHQGTLPVVDPWGLLKGTRLAGAVRLILLGRGGAQANGQDAGTFAHSLTPALMISIVLYGRNDSYGYNLHKRAALGINTMAELLSAPTDEILFVDYNTPDDHPTFPEAIADTLTDRAAALLRILRVRPAIHDRIRDRTHLKALEPIARNVAVRRSNPANRWILSTNTDMIFVPRGQESLSRIVADLPPGFYHLPRFELPESLWEGFDRKDPASVIQRVRAYGRTMFLNEIVYGAECIKYDAPGDFQLILRDDLFRINGFDEEMLLGWHVDSNIAKRLYLIYGVVGDLVERLFGYHCDHTRQVTPMHQHKAAANDAARFIDNVTDPCVLHQARSWGCAGDDIEDVRLTQSAHHVYLDGLRSVLRGEWTEPVTARYTYDSYGQSTYDARHVLPFLADLFASMPRALTLAWLGGRADTFAAFRQTWSRMGFQGEIVIDEWSTPLLMPAAVPGVRSSDVDGLNEAVDVLVFDFGKPSDAHNPLSALGVPAGRLDAAVDSLTCRSFLQLVERERERLARGAAPRRFVCVNAIHNRYESLVRDEIGVASTPFATRLRHGFVVPERTGGTQPKVIDTVLPDDDVKHEAWADVLERMSVREGGRRVGTRVVAPFGRRGYVIRGFPYDRLLPGTYQVEFSVEPRSPFTFGAYVRPVILEVVAGSGYLARERVTFFMRGTLTLTFSIPEDQPQGLNGVEVRIFRGRFVDFVITGLRLWQLPALEAPPVKTAGAPRRNPLLEMLGISAEASSAGAP